MSNNIPDLSGIHWVFTQIMLLHVVCTYSGNGKVSIVLERETGVNQNVVIMH